MGLRNLSILIPSYKRPEVLEATLCGLLNNTCNTNKFEVSIGVGLNKGGFEEDEILVKYEKFFNNRGMPFQSVSYENNIGKATILNILFKLYASKSDLVVTMDNDMVISKPWLHLISLCDAIEYDIMGFCGARFWAHDPVRENCSYVGNFVDDKPITFYTPHSVAGGMMLFHSQFLKDNPWTNHGGVYGRDDASMCLLTNKKYVINSDEDWLVHDPLKDSTPILKNYEEKKKALYEEGTTVFPIGWDE